jgi:hypothetical protein
VLDTPKPPLAVTADKAYDSEKVRQQIKDDGALPIIRAAAMPQKKAYCPKRFYRRRHKIENYFCRLKDRRRIANALRQVRPDLPCRHRPRRALYRIKL